MRFRLWIAFLLILCGCATADSLQKESVNQSPRRANLQRAATLPWKDGGRCVVQEASQPWPELVEQCFHALDHERIRFHDPTGRCAVASAGAAAMGIGICILTAPEIVAGAVVVTGVVFVAVAIKKALDAYELKGVHPEEEQPVTETKPVSQEPSEKQRPTTGGAPSGPDGPPPPPPEPEEKEPRPECIPKRVPPKGGNNRHNRCADKMEFNAFRRANALVNGKAFDALQLPMRVLWEIKTDNFDTFSAYLQMTVPENQVLELRRERLLALACGYDFRVGVISEEHKAALERLDKKLKIVVMDWCKDDPLEEE